MGKNTYNDRAKRPPAFFFEKLILVSFNFYVLIRNALTMYKHVVVDQLGFANKKH